MVYFYYVLLAIISYFIGNVNFARVIAKFKKDDITTHGSGNPGTLNAWRSYGFWPGVLTFALDMLKGVIPTLVAFLTFGYIGCESEIAAYIAGLVWFWAIFSQLYSSLKVEKALLVRLACLL